MQVKNWNRYWIGKAMIVSSQSKDPSSQVGCVIVDSQNNGLSDGYNGNVPGCDETFVPIIRPNKYLTIGHAEQHAVIRSHQDLTNCKAYVTDAPCEMCLKLLLMAGCREVWYLDPKIMRDRSSQEQKDAIKALILATGAQVKNMDGVDYLKELGFET